VSNHCSDGTHGGISFLGAGSRRTRSIDRGEQGNRENVGAASFPPQQRAGSVAVMQAQATSVRCGGCCWNGSLGELVAFCCPSCGKARSIVRVS
jgi:hypothetical protein